MAGHEEEVLGKAYDSRLTKRLLRYLRPYSGQVFIALAAIVIKAGADVLGPYLTKVAVDKYLAQVPGTRSILDGWTKERERFLKVIPVDYKRALAEKRARSIQRPQGMRSS